jgi:hypothetical protein
MKYILSLLLLLSLPSYAQETKCREISEIAGQIMSLRQLGADPLNILSKVNEPLVTKMVQMAYSEPRYQTSEYRQMAILRFRDQFAIECLKWEMSK